MGETHPRIVPFLGIVFLAWYSFAGNFISLSQIVMLILVNKIIVSIIQRLRNSSGCIYSIFYGVLSIGGEDSGARLAPERRIIR
jgi:hypothetical protein